MTTATFEYEAVGAEGVIHGRRSAPSEVVLDRELERQGLTLLRARVVDTRGGERRRGLNHDEIVLFTGQLSTVVSAGVPLVQGLRALGKRMVRPEAKATIETLARELEGGASLSEALEAHGGSFDPVYRASVRAGEQSGALPAILRRMAEHLDWVRAMRQATVQALLYPGLLCLAIGVLVAVLVTFVVPRIVGMFPGGAGQLPWQTRHVMGVSAFVTGNWGALLLALAALGGGLVALTRRKEGRRWCARALLAVPRLGRVLRMLAIARFAGTAATLQNAGCDIYSVLGLGSAACGNPAIEPAFERVIERVKQGQALSRAFEREPEMDPMLIQMIAIGEQSGDLGQALEELATYYNREVPRLVKWFMALAEPAILVVAAVAVGYLLLATLLPVLDMYEQIG